MSHDSQEVGTGNLVFLHKFLAPPNKATRSHIFGNKTAFYWRIEERREIVNGTESGNETIIDDGSEVRYILQRKAGGRFSSQGGQYLFLQVPARIGWATSVNAWKKQTSPEFVPAGLDKSQSNCGSNNSLSGAASLGEIFWGSSGGSPKR